MWKTEIQEENRNCPKCLIYHYYPASTFSQIPLIICEIDNINNIDINKNEITLYSFVSYYHNKIFHCFIHNSKKLQSISLVDKLAYLPNLIEKYKAYK